MNHILASRWFLVSTTICCAVGVAFTSWLARDSSGGVRVVAALIGLVAALAVMLLVAWALAIDERPSTEPEPAADPPTSVTDPPLVARDVLASQLEEGHALRHDLEPDTSDDRVSAWIEEVRGTIERHKPSVLGYFDALAARRYADDRERLDAHLGRLATVVRDFL
jgi:hypothetical protein